MFSLLLFTALPGQETVTYFLIANPLNLTIYNRYQQRLTEDEIRQRFAPLQPLRVEERAMMLSDGFTRCFRIREGRDIFFIETDENSNPRFGGQTSEFDFLENCVPLGDSVEVLQGNVLFIVPALAYPNVSDDRKIRLATDEKLLLLFEWKKQIFAKQPGNPVIYGWVNLATRDEGKSWQRIIREAPVTRTPVAEKSFEEVLDFAEFQTGEINRVLAGLYAHFNTRLDQNRLPPHWEISTEDERRIELRLLNSGEKNRFAESTRYLFLRLENYLLNSGFEASLRGADIVVIRKPL